MAANFMITVILFTGPEMCSEFYNQNTITPLARNFRVNLIDKCRLNSYQVFLVE
jgi:hypothetical protein